MAYNIVWLCVCYFGLQTLTFKDKFYSQNNSTKPLLVAGAEIETKMAKGINTYEISMAGNKVCKKCDKNGNVFVKNDYADRWSRRTNTNSKGEVGWYCKCKKCGGTKNLGKVSKLSTCL